MSEMGEDRREDQHQPVNDQPRANQQPDEQTQDRQQSPRDQEQHQEERPQAAGDQDTEERAPEAGHSGTNENQRPESGEDQHVEDGQETAEQQQVEDEQRFREALQKSGKGMFDAVVVSNRKIGDDFYKMELKFKDDGAEVFAGFRPGQFAELDLSGAPLPPTESIPEHLRDASARTILLRRPFSFTNVTPRRGRTLIELLYCVVGPATVRMTNLKGGDRINAIGPLGNGFYVPDGKKTALLAVGGMGTAPLQHLARYLTEKHHEIAVIAFAGARTAEALPFERKRDEISQQLGFSLPEFARYGIESVVATDDGSVGYKGFITDCLCKWLDENKPDPTKTIIYSCGPEVMLAAMAKIAAQRRIDCQISMERRMACGIGLCQSCAVECKVPDSDETTYKMCCQEGPVFDSREVVFKD